MQIKNYQILIDEKKYSMMSDDEYLDKFKNKGFEPKLIRLFESVIPENSECILDIGANVGCTALYFSKKTTNVHAFEPSLRTFDFLIQNINSNNLKNIEAFNLGVGRVTEDLTLDVNPNHRFGAFVSNQIQIQGHEREVIHIVTLDSLLDKINQSISLVKIDVEGFEKQVILGGHLLLAKHEPVVVLELNHWCLNALQRTSVPDFFDFLKSEFPILYAVDGSRYLDLHCSGDEVTVMYHHILEGYYSNIVAGYHQEQFQKFLCSFEHGHKPRNKVKRWTHLKRFIKGS